jgi:MoaA/NifB/PqqE/SkfB family radical SAM enzyme
MKKTLLTINRRMRETKMFIHALRSPYHPILVHLVPTRRCNLACTYCSEYDDFSQPIPTEEMYRRIDHLAELGATMVHLSGGEPLLHPHADKLIARIRSHGMIAGLLTNGFLLGPKRIKELNQAGLDHLQISIDNVQPDATSKKSLKTLDKKLQHLAEHAHFNVNINSVLGAELERPEDALDVAKRVNELGFSGTVGIIHDSDGQLRPLNEKQIAIFDEISALDKSVFSAASHDEFQQNMVRGQPTDWFCRAGARYLYVCEDGLVHYCSQQRGTPGTPLLDYTPEDLEREATRNKECAPYCTVSCVHRVSWLDSLRVNPVGALQKFFPASNGGKWSTQDLPVSVRMLAWLFLPRGEERRPTLATRLVTKMLSNGSKNGTEPRMQNPGGQVPDYQRD